MVFRHDCRCEKASLKPWKKLIFLNSPLMICMVKKNIKIEELKAKAGSNKKARMGNILMEMQVKLKEIDSLRKDLVKEQYNSISPQKSMSMLEEIKVPSIELIKEEKRR